MIVLSDGDEEWRPDECRSMRRALCDGPAGWRTIWDLFPLNMSFGYC